MKTIAFRLAENTPRACTAEHNGTRYVIQRRADAQRWHVYADGLPLCSDTYALADAFEAVRSHAASKARAAAGGCRCCAGHATTEIAGLCRQCVAGDCSHTGALARRGL